MMPNLLRLHRSKKPYALKAADDGISTLTFYAFTFYALLPPPNPHLEATV